MTSNPDRFKGKKLKEFSLLLHTCDAQQHYYKLFFAFFPFSATNILFIFWRGSFLLKYYLISGLYLKSLCVGGLYWDQLLEKKRFDFFGPAWWNQKSHHFVKKSYEREIWKGNKFWIVFLNEKFILRNI